MAPKMASSSSSQRRVIHPGPDDPSLLTLQQTHVSTHVWNGDEERPLTIRRALADSGGPIPDAIVPHLQRAGFLGVAQLSFFQVNHGLISALLERWRPETHTFHMPHGECTITLQDVAVQLGLRVDGLPVTGETSLDWVDLMDRLLGMSPPADKIRGGSVRMSWLDANFGDITGHMDDDVQIERFARAYILRLIGGVMFVDHSSSLVPLRYLALLEDLNAAGQYSWGSAVLSYLYREMCKTTDYHQKEICGFTLLIQLWAWDRFPSIAPKGIPGVVPNQPIGCRWIGGSNFSAPIDDVLFYRHKFDHLKRHDIVWEPYTPVLLAQLPHICMHGEGIWRAVVPMICFHIVEWHQPDRCMRQFGMMQHIPDPPRQVPFLHDLTLRGKHTQDWVAFHSTFIQMWNDRLQHVIQNAPQVEALGANSEYMRWYKARTRRWMTRRGALSGKLADDIERIHYFAVDEDHSSMSWEELQETCAYMLDNLDMADRISEPVEPAPEPGQHVVSPPPAT